MANCNAQRQLPDRGSDVLETRFPDRLEDSGPSPTAGARLSAKFPSAFNHRTDRRRARKESAAPREPNPRQAA